MEPAKPEITEEGVTEYRTDCIIYASETIYFNRHYNYNDIENSLIGKYGLL